MARKSDIRRLVRGYVTAPHKLGLSPLRGLNKDPGAESAISACCDWLVASQLGSLSADGGCASHYDILAGWASSYPETTGYIVPTLFELADRNDDRELANAAGKMLDWLASIQMESGGFQGGNIDATPKREVVFNTGQILFGLVEGAKRFGDPYDKSAIRAADWLVSVQDSDGSWSKGRSPFTTGGAKTYEAHVSWAMAEADRVFPDKGYGRTAIRHSDWVLAQQLSNGWFEACSLGDDEHPNTHTIGYTLRGLFEVWRLCRYEPALEGARLVARTLCQLVSENGFLSGKFDRNWKPTTSTACVTGSAQIANSLILLAQASQEKESQYFTDVANRLNSFVRRTIPMHGPDGIRGGVSGSYPIWGEYGPFRYLNWAAKFTIDSNLAEIDARKDMN